MPTPSFPAWSALLLVFSAGMLVIAFSGVLLGWRRLRVRPRRVRSRVARNARPSRLARTASTDDPMQR